MSALRRYFLPILAILMLVVGAAILTRQNPPANMPWLSVRNQDRDGAMLLREWLDRIGYRTRELAVQPIDLTGVDVLFVLRPNEPFTPEEVDRIITWIRQGKTLILYGCAKTNLRSPLGLDVWFPAWEPDRALIWPSLNRPPLSDLNTRFDCEDSATDASYVLHHDPYSGQPLVGSFQVDAGRVWLVNSTDLLDNSSLSENPDRGKVLLNMLADVPVGSVLAFDEVRHGFARPPENILEWVLVHPAGHGLILILVLTFVYAGLRGRRFGSVIPLPETRTRREAVEYVHAIARLLRQSGHRQELQRHYLLRLRRRLAEQCRIDPDLSDADFAHAVAMHAPSIPETELLSVLKRLQAPNLSEGAIVLAIADGEDLLAAIAPPANR